MTTLASLLTSAYNNAPTTMWVTGDFLGFHDLELPVEKSDILSTLNILVNSYVERPDQTKAMFRGLWSTLKAEKDLESETFHKNLVVFYLLRQILFGNPIPYTC